MRAARVETERLELRLLQKSDYEAFLEGYRSCGPAKNPFDEGRIDTAFMTRAWFELLAAGRRREAGADLSYQLQIFRKEDGRSVGYCDVTPLARGEIQSGRLGYALHNTYWGQGYGTECVRALVRFGFETLKLHRLEANIDPENLASQRAAEQAGLRFECVREAYLFRGGLWRDQRIYVCTNPALREPDEAFG